MKKIVLTPMRQPRDTPRMKRLGRFPVEGGKDQRFGIYWDVMTAQRMNACNAKATSLNWTVGVNPWLRAAYCARMRGE